MRRAHWIRIAVAGLAGTWLVCGGAARAADDAGAAKMPKATDISYYYDNFEHSIFRPIARSLDPSLLVRKVAHDPREAANIDEHDQVRLPSTWWQPRLGFRDVTVEQMLHGPGDGAGPAPGKLKVTRAKSQGVTPGFFIKDSQGVTFILKFDPKDQPEMATGADVVASYLFWAAGYNVPDNSIEVFRRDDLEIAKDGSYTDPLGHKRPLTEAYLDKLMEGVPQRPDGSYRAIASRLLPGKPLGPFEYRGRRRDDPEDRIPHELHRELRGLWTMAAWTNHADVRGPNSLDMWVSEGGRSFVRHHLIDFGACLGSSSVGERAPQTGSEYFVDYGVMAHSLVTLGLHRPPWETTVDPELPSVGFVEASAFDTKSWRPFYPNPAFDDRTERDVRWGARIVTGFTDAHIRAAVEQGKYTDPRATEYLTQVLIQRRDMLVRRWLGETGKP